MDACMDSFLTQHISEETHRSGHILDLLLTTDESMVNCVKMIGRIGSSDHEAMLVEMNLESGGLKNNFMRNYGRGDFKSMRRELDIDWKEKMSGMTVEEMWAEIEGRISEATLKFIPLKKVNPTGRPRWMSKELERLIKEKRSAWTKWKRTRSEHDKSEYKKLETRVKKVIRNRKNVLEKNIAKEAKRNPKSFFAFINKRRKTRAKIGPLRSENGTIIVDPAEQAESFNAHYSSVFTRSEKEPPTIEHVTNEKIEDVVISVELIKSLIDGLKESSSPGPDGISNRVLKELRDELATPLQMLFRKSLDEGEVPQSWKDSVISPIYKKGSKGEPINYRPVNLTSNVCKLMERVLKIGIEEHLEKNVLSNSQHGFRRGRSPQTNLIEFVDKITKWVDEGKSVDVVFFDLSKAFDRVCHKRLAIKMEAVGIHGKVKIWVCNWLDGRRQAVRVEDCLSEWRPVDSSVPQGTVLGGTMFNIYVDDIDEDVEGFVRKFADDTKDANVVECQSDAEKFQKDIDAMVAWAERWEMAFSVEKCKVIHLGRNNKRFEYRMGNETLKVADEEKDLGVLFGSSLKPSAQCEKAAKEANGMLGAITRAFHYRTKHVMVPLYKAFVRPKLEYASSVWCPWLQKDIDELEKVQKRMVKMLSGVKARGYEERLEEIGMMSLTERRTRGDMIETFKTLRGHNRVEKEAWFEFQEEEARPTRSNTTVVDGTAVRKKEVLIQQRANLEVRKNFFTVRAAGDWNALPDAVKASTSVNSFKNAYDAWKWRQKTSQNES